jgi:hypothetical protein
MAKTTDFAKSVRAASEYASFTAQEQTEAEVVLRDQAHGGHHPGRGRRPDRPDRRPAPRRIHGIRHRRRLAGRTGSRGRVMPINVKHGLGALAAAVSVPDLPIHTAPDAIHAMPIHAARQLLAAEMAPAGDAGLYGRALASVLAERLLAPEVLALAAILRGLTAYRPEPDEAL